MSETDVLPEVKQIVGALFFTQRQPLTVKQILKVFPQTAESYAGATSQYGAVGEDDVEAAIAQFRDELDRGRLGFHLVSVAGGWRLQNDRGCGPWVRTLLEKGKPNRLSRPALETLSIVAYRQPITRADIEGIRGGSADAIVRSLLEMGLVKVAGRSELPGRPWLFGTTQLFLESFGLNSLDDLPGMEELRRNAKQAEQQKAATQVAEKQGVAALAEAEDVQANVVEPVDDAKPKRSRKKPAEPAPVATADSQTPADPLKDSTDPTDKPAVDAPTDENPEKSPVNNQDNEEEDDLEQEDEDLEEEDDEDEDEDEDLEEEDDDDEEEELEEEDEDLEDDEEEELEEVEDDDEEEELDDEEDEDEEKEPEKE